MAMSFSAPSTSMAKTASTEAVKPATPKKPAATTKRRRAAAKPTTKD